MEVVIIITYNYNGNYDNDAIATRVIDFATCSLLVALLQYYATTCLSTMLIQQLSF